MVAILAAAFATALMLAVLVAPEAQGGVRYKAMLSVNGGLTVTSQVDNLKNCQPGQAWTLTEDADISIRDKVVIESSGARLLSSSSAVTNGGAISKHALTSYEESNFCPPDEPIELDRPNCGTFTGKGVASLRQDGRLRKPWRVAIGFGRTTGGMQAIDCMSLGLGSATPKGSLINRFETIFSGTTLPLDLKVSSFKKLGVGKKLIRTIRIGGDCSGPIVYRGPKVSKAADGDCSVEGVYNVEIKRLTKTSKQGVSLASIGRSAKGR